METKIVEKAPVRDLFLRTVAVLGLIAILLLGAWGIIQLAFALPTVFSNLGGSVASLFTHNTGSTATSTKEAVTVSAPGSITSGQTLQVSWVHANADQSGQYSYAVSFACHNGLTLKAPLPNGSYQTVPCNTLFNYTNATQHMAVVPAITGSASVPLTMTVVATKLSTGASTATGSTTTTVTPVAAATPAPAATTPASSATKPSTTYYPAATRATSLYGYGDLAVTITSVAPSANNTRVKFTISNVGTNVVNAGWTFNATLPINGSYVFGSQPQQALYPGDKIVYTLNYDAGTYGTPYMYGSNQYGYATSGYSCNGYVCNNNNVVTNYPYGQTSYNSAYATAPISVTADPLNMVPEYNKGNNTAQTTVPLY